MHVIIFDYRRIKTFSKLINFKKINQREVINFKIWNGKFLTEQNPWFSKNEFFRIFQNAEKNHFQQLIFDKVYVTAWKLFIIWHLIVAVLMISKIKCRDYQEITEINMKFIWLLEFFSLVGKISPQEIILKIFLESQKYFFIDSFRVDVSIWAEYLNKK